MKPHYRVLLAADTEPTGSAPEGSSAPVSTPDASAPSSGAQPDPTEGLEAAIRKGLESVQATEPKAGTKDVSKEPPSDQDGIETAANDKATEPESPETTESATPEPEGEGEPEKGPIPYERFQEVVQARRDLETKLAEQEAVVTAQRSITDYCQTNEIAPEEFQFWLEVAALSKRDPEGALKKLQPHLETWKGFTGESLNPDLAKAVEDGEISLDYAKRLQAAENQKQHASRQVARTAEQENARRQQEALNSMLGSFNQWLQTKQKSDLSFTAKKAANAPDGMYEFFLYKLNAEAPKAGIKDAAGLVALAEQVYAHAQQVFGQKTGAPKSNGRVLRTNSSGGTVSRGEPKSLDEAILRGAEVAGFRKR